MKAEYLIGLLIGLTIVVTPAVEAEVHDTYVIDFLATASEGVDMNDAGVAVGDRDLCGWPCPTPSEVGVWSDGAFTPLPLLPHWENVYLEAINNNGWVVGSAFNQTDIRGVVWKPAGSNYEIFEIPNLPETNFTELVGIDDSNRVIGSAYRFSPANYRPLLWTEADGSLDLFDIGFPHDLPHKISPGGTVAYLYGWYQLDVPGAVHENVAAPDGFRGPGAYMEINDTGDQLRLLAPTNGQNINYPFRYTHEGTWQQLWPSGGIDASPFGVGSITSSMDIALTISATGLAAPGPAGGADLLNSRLAPSYGDSTVSGAAALTESGEILAKATIGNSTRTVRLVPAEPCIANCMVVERLDMAARFVDDPSDPGQCVGSAHTRARARLRVTDETGAPIAGVRVSGVFLDSYWTEDFRQAITDANGSARLSQVGEPCTGTLSFLVTKLEKPGFTFDRTNGILTTWKIPD